MSKSIKINVKKRDGRLEELNVDKINKVVEKSCSDLEGVSPSEIVLDTKIQFFDRITTKEIDKSLITTAASKIYKELNYSYAAAKLLLNTIYKEVLKESRDEDTFEDEYRTVFIKNIKKLIKAEICHKDLLNFDLQKLAKALKPERDLIFEYHSILNISDRYLIRLNDKIMETPQAFYMRIAMGLAKNELNKEDFVIETYNMYSQHLAMPSSPTLFNSGTNNGQLASCFLQQYGDSIDGIFDGLHQSARKSKHAGGLAMHITTLRATGSHIKGTNGTSSGIMPWMKLMDATLVAVNQSGKRNGSGCAYIENWHYDYEDFLEARKETGEETRRTHNLNIASFISDLFMERVQQDGDWTLFCPSEVLELPDLYGNEFKEKYIEYEEKAKDGKMKLAKVVKAKELWKKMLKVLFETSHPWMTWKDPINLRYQNKHEGAVHGSNLCCVAGDQRVITEKGILTVKELYLNESENKVVGRDGIYNATKMFLPRPNAPMVKIVTNEGYTHKITPDHPVWVVNVGWTEAQNLKPDDKVEIQQIEGLWGDANLPEEAFICGLVAGDGTFSENAVCIDLWEKDFFIIAEVEKMVENILIRAECTDIHGNGTLAPKFAINKEGIKARLSSVALFEAFEKLGFTKENKLKIPEFVWKGTKETVSSYISGLYLADATTQATTELTTCSLSNVNEKLLQDVQILLANLGIKTSLTLMREEEIHEMPNGKGGVQDYNCQPLYRLHATFIKANRILEKATKIASFRKNNQFLENIQKDGYKQKLFATIKEIVSIPNEDAYCLTVDSNDHAWTCNGFITKNTEITIHSKASEYVDGKKTKIGKTGVCSLASINLKAHVVLVNDKYVIDRDKLKNTIRNNIRCIDNAVTLNRYPTEESKNSALCSRDLGMGTMGWADVYYLMDILQDSEEGIEFADELMEYISYCAIEASSDLAVERGKYENYEGSNWSNGILPIDTYEDLCKNHGRTYVGKTRLNWQPLRNKILEQGMRNAQVMAIAPNASIAYQLGVEQSIEPSYTNLFVYDNKSGKYYIINKYFVNDMKKEGLWTPTLAEQLKIQDGNVSNLDIPEKYKRKYIGCYERDQLLLIKANAARQKWIDQSISFNGYSNKNSLKFLAEYYIMSWEYGLKSNYYLRTPAASKTLKAEGKVTSVESPTVTVTVNDAAQACSIEAMKSGGTCTMCEG